MILQEDNPIEKVSENKLPNVTLHFVMPEETRAEHCQHDSPTIGQELMADWLADVFGIDRRDLMTRFFNPLI